MSATNQDSGNGSVVLPQGWQIGPGRENAQTQPNNQVIQGLTYPLTSPNGTTTSVFIPYSMIGNLAQVQGLIDARTSGILAIEG